MDKCFKLSDEILAKGLEIEGSLASGMRNQRNISNLLKDLEYIARVKPESQRIQRELDANKVADDDTHKKEQVHFKGKYSA